MRRFAFTNLRDFGMGKKACEDKITEECEQLIEVFRTFKGKSLGVERISYFEQNKTLDLLSLVAGEAFDTTNPMNYAVSNIICSMVYGSRFEYDDPQFKSLVDRMTRNTKLMGSPSIQVRQSLFHWPFHIKSFLVFLTALQHVPMDLQMDFQQKRNPQELRLQ